MEAKDYVGWTVTVANLTDGVFPGIYYCISLNKFGDLQLARRGEPRNENLDSMMFVNWWIDPNDVMRLRQGDWAQ